jgi:hypothetical protein
MILEQQTLTRTFQGTILLVAEKNEPGEETSTEKKALTAGTKPW